MLSHLNVVLCTVGGGVIGWLVLATYDHLQVLLANSEEHPEGPPAEG